MSVVVHGMEMPTSCYQCNFCCNATDGKDTAVICTALEKEIIPLMAERQEDCPLVEVPPHGRLIDADSLVISIGPIIPEDSLIPCTIESAKFLMFKHIAYANTIIEAEVET